MRLVIAFAVLLLATPVVGQEAAKPTRRPLAITHVTLIDATGRAAQADQTVLIQDQRIVAIGKTAEVKLPADSEVADGHGKFLIPGLWDMHAHIAAVSPADADNYLTLFIANGVTGVREMHSYFPEMIFALRKSIQDDKRLGPWIVAAGAMIDGPNPSAGGALVASSDEAARAAVRSLKKRGADFIKVHSKLPRDAYFGVADEAKRQGLPFAGHVPESVSAQEASDAGQKSIEHLTGLWISCSADESSLRNEMTRELASGRAGDLVPLMRVWLKPFDSFRESKAESLYRSFTRNHTWQTPTLVLVKAACSLDDPDFTSDPRVRYMPAFVQGFWDVGNPQNQALRKSLSNLKRVSARSLEEVGKMHRAGVEIMTGTDTPFPFCFPGFSLHDELALLLKAGLTPMEALQCATRNPARYLGRIEDVGTIEKGKFADLLLLDANPLEDIKNTQRIAAVIVHGHLLNRETLRTMLEQVASTSRPNK
jgi:imidazolonepropionase-like amidohydrolase